MLYFFEITQVPIRAITISNRSTVNVLIIFSLNKPVVSKNGFSIKLIDIEKDVKNIRINVSLFIAFFK